MPHKNATYFNVTFDTTQTRKHCMAHLEANLHIGNEHLVLI